MDELFNWNEVWNTGIDSIDAEHRHMASTLNRIARLLPDNQTDHAQLPVITQRLDEFITITRSHFHHEEEQMRQVGYPGLAAHKREHAILLAELREFVKLIRRGRARVDNRTRHALKQWFIAHLVISDREFARYYHSRG